MLLTLNSKLDETHSRSVAIVNKIKAIKIVFIN